MTTRAAVALLMAIGVATPGRPAVGDATYHRVDDWAHLPSGVSWGVMSAVAVDAHHDVYALQRAEPDARILVFGADGTLLRTFATGTFTYAHGLRVLRDGAVWATDRQMQQVLKFSPEGALLMTLGRKGVAGDNASRDAFNGVSDVAMAENGDLFVSDGEGANTRVVKFSATGSFIATWGTKGAGPGQLSGPHCVAIDPNGQVWVCDRGNKRLQVFDQTGRFVREIAQFGTPVSIAFGAGDRVYVASPAPENRVTIGTVDGRILETIDGLDAPHGIAVDTDGTIYVAQSAGK